jgi:hypothetical protein
MIAGGISLSERDGVCLALGLFTSVLAVDLVSAFICGGDLALAQIFWQPRQTLGLG